MRGRRNQRGGTFIPGKENSGRVRSGAKSLEKKLWQSRGGDVIGLPTREETDQWCGETFRPGGRDIGVPLSRGG